MHRYTRTFIIACAGIFGIAATSFAQQERPMPDRGRQPPVAGEPLPGGRRPPPGEGPRPGFPGPDRGQPVPGEGFGPPEGLRFSRGGSRPIGPPIPRQEMQRLEQEDPEMYALVVQDEQLERDTLHAAEQLRRAETGERDRLKKALTELVNKHFDVRQQRRELQLKRMEDELKRLRDAIAKRNEEREAIIDRRLSELVGDPKDLEF